MWVTVLRVTQFISIRDRNEIQRQKSVTQVCSYIALISHPQHHLCQYHYELLVSVRERQHNTFTWVHIYNYLASLPELYIQMGEIAS